MRPHLVSLQSANWFDMKAWNILCGYSQSPIDPTSNIFPLPVLLPVKKCETFPELFHISLLFPVPFPEAAPQQPVCLLNVFTFFCCHFKFLLCLCIDELKPFQQLCLWIIMFCQLRKFQCMNLKFITIQLLPLSDQK